MSRSEEIRAQLEELKTRKEGRSAEAHALREELRSLEAPPPVQIDATFAPAEPAEAHESPFDSDEYRFLERCCQEAQLPRGSSAGMAKTLFNEIAAKRLAWLIMREVISQVGVGQPTWPQWSELGRDNGTGELMADYETRQKAEIAKAEAIKALEIERAKQQREAEAAQGGRVVAVQGPSELEQLAMSTAAAVGAAISGSPEPPKEKHPETVNVD